MDGNPGFTVHATAHAFRAVINLNNVAIGNPERYVRKASHRGSKQQ